MSVDIVLVAPFCPIYTVTSSVVVTLGFAVNVLKVRIIPLSCKLVYQNSCNSTASMSINMPKTFLKSQHIFHPFHVLGFVYSHSHGISMLDNIKRRLLLKVLFFAPLSTSLWSKNELYLNIVCGVCGYHLGRIWLLMPQLKLFGN